nr:RNA-directed DNA polymerase, eukaryota, reverse transcriptase zinc-binding domain protein [Tanacetum cinerariifolium]
MVDGDWIDDPDLVKQEFRNHFTDRFQDPGSRRGSLNFLFPSRLSNDQILDLESPISKDEIRTAVWGCGVDKSPGPDGFTFEFFRKYWAVVGPDFSTAKSHLLGVGIPDNCIAEAVKSIGCSIMKAPFKYLGTLVGDNMSSIKAWDETISKMKKRLSRWKLNTLSVGSRLTLLKSVLGSTTIYNMSIFKVPKSILNLMESLIGTFLMAFKMVIKRLLGSNGLSSIINEVNSLKDKGVDLISHCKIKVGKGMCTSFWNDLWIGDSLLKLSFTRPYALEEKKLISVTDKMRTSISFSFCRPVRGGIESQQHEHLLVLLDPVILSNMEDICFWDLNGDGVFHVKDVRILLDEAFLPKMEVLTRWIKSILIKYDPSEGRD